MLSHPFFKEVVTWANGEPWRLGLNKSVQVSFRIICKCNEVVCTEALAKQGIESHDGQDKFWILLCCGDWGGAEVALSMQYISLVDKIISHY